jgi:uncharacterized phage infection (PIP) family protein YhgE
MNGVHILDGVPQTLAHGAEDGASKIAGAVESAGARVAKGAGHVAKNAGKNAGQVAKNAGQASGKASELSGQLSGRASELSGQLSGKASELSGLQEKLSASMRSATKRRSRLLPKSDAMLKAQLVKTSRELAHESSDLNAAVDSLNRIIKSNRRAAAKGRTRLLGGLALGAALMYHLDAEHGRERRAATARAVTNMIRGQKQPPSAAH